MVCLLVAAFPSTRRSMSVFNMIWKMTCKTCKIDENRFFNLSYPLCRTNTKTFFFLFADRYLLSPVPGKGSAYALGPITPLLIILLFYFFPVLKVDFHVREACHHLGVYTQMRCLWVARCAHQWVE